MTARIVGLYSIRILISILFLLVLAGVASAQCTGSGTTWACPAGATPAQVNTMIGSASNGATATFANGSYSWGSGTIIGLSNSKGITLICASVGGCNVNSSGTVIGLGQYASGTNANLYRISGFTFNYTGTSFMIWFAYSGDCGTATAPCIMTQVRVDHNTVNATNGSGGMVMLAFADDASVLYTFGVMDHNTLNSPASVQMLLVIAGLNTAPLPNALGTSQNFFMENNNLNITTMTNAGFSCIDGWGSARIVARFNTSTNCLWALHGVSHEGGPDSAEFYGNNYTVNSGASGAGFADGYRAFHHQGSGSFLAFNNQFTIQAGLTPNGSIIEMLHYRDYPNGIDGGLPFDASQCNGLVSAPTDAPYITDGNRAPIGINAGYPCWRQPGRDVATQNYLPMYAWNNTLSTGAQVLLNVPDGGYGTPPGPDFQPNHLQNNRDYFNAVSASAQTTTTSPFNGTTGMGYGTLAHRPPTCTTSTETAFGHGAAGVGYFATDVGTLGTLFTCSATNTWTSLYTPYTYPHPLVGGGTAAITYSISGMTVTSYTWATPVIVGSGSPTQVITVTNTGTATLTMTLPFNTTDPTQFQIVSNNCASGFGGVLAAGASCTETLQFVPSGTGSQTASLTITGNASATINLAGTGTGSFTPQPPTLLFGLSN